MTREDYNKASKYIDVIKKLEYIRDYIDNFSNVGLKIGAECINLSLNDEWSVNISTALRNTIDEQIKELEKKLNEL